MLGMGRPYGIVSTLDLNQKEPVEPELAWIPNGQKIEILF